MSIKKNFTYNFLLTNSNFLFPLITFPYLSRILGAESLGICNFIISYAQNFIIIAALGLPVYGSREIAKSGSDLHKRTNLFFELLIIHFSMTILLLIIYISTIYITSDLYNYKKIALLGAVYIFANLFSIEWFYIGTNNFKYIAIRSFLIRLLSLFAVFIFIKNTDDYFKYFLITTITVITTSILNLYNLRKYIIKRIQISVINLKKHIKALTVLGTYMVMTNIYTLLPITLLGFLSTKEATGYYYTSNRIILMIVSLFSALITVLLPHLNRILEQGQITEYKKIISKALDVVIIFGIPITSLVFLLSKQIVLIIAGQNFVNSVYLLKLMSPIIFFVAAAQVFVLLILNVNRKDNDMVKLALIGMSLSLALNLTFIPFWGEKATALAQLVAEMTVCLFAFYYAKKVLDFNFPIGKLLKNILLAISFSFITLILNNITQNPFGVLISSIGICTSYYLYFQIFIIKEQFILNYVNLFLNSRLFKNNT